MIICCTITISLCNIKLSITFYYQSCPKLKFQSRIYLKYYKCSSVSPRLEVTELIIFVVKFKRKCISQHF